MSVSSVFFESQQCFLWKALPTWSYIGIIIHLYPGRSQDHFIIDVGVKIIGSFAAPASPNG